MVDLKRSQIRVIEEAMAYPQGFGYVLDFSDRTISEYFEDEFGINFDDPKYAANGSSKRSRLTTFIATEDAYTVAKILRALWDRREGLIRKSGGNVSEAAEEETRRAVLDIIASVEGSSEIPRTDALDRYARDRTIDELIHDIERDLQANKPEAAMDHLHTYCVKKFTHLLRTRGVDCSDDEALHARFGKYRKELLKERELNAFTDRAMKSAISLFESYNIIRNHHSFAHDNPILEPAEARYVFDTVSAILIFLRAIEAGRYEG
jgi:hypothetical protein